MVLKNENSKFLGGYLIDQDPSEQGKQKGKQKFKNFCHETSETHTFKTCLSFVGMFWNPSNFCFSVHWSNNQQMKKKTAFIWIVSYKNKVVH